MYLQSFGGVLLLFQIVTALESPCLKKNVTLLSGVNFHPLVNPSQCGHVIVNETEFKVEPNIIYNAPTVPKDRFTVMLLRVNPKDHNIFFLHWLISNITPVAGSLTANKTARVSFKDYAPVVAIGQNTRYWLYIFKQNASIPFNRLSDSFSFSPQKWINNRSRSIEKLVGGLEFDVKPSQLKVQPNFPNVRPTTWPRQCFYYYTTIRSPGRYVPSNTTNSSLIYGWNNRTNISYPNQPYRPVYPPPYPQPNPPPYPQPNPPPVIINNPPQQPGVVHHYYNSPGKGKKGTASSIAALMPLIFGLAWGAVQL